MAKKKSLPSAASSTSTSLATPTQVNFPAIPSPIHTPLLSITLLESQILLLPNFLQAETCKDYKTAFSSLPLQPSPPPGRNEATRTNSRLAVSDPVFASYLFNSTGLADFTHDWTVKLGKRTLECKGLHSNIRIYKYEQGTFFGPHYDSSTRDSVNGFTSYWTLLIYLSGKEDGVEGGETVFYRDGKKKGGEIFVGIERGLALLHRHGGSDCLLHEGRTVTKGTKWVLRSDLIFG
jgi:hypothetical protein